MDILKELVLAREVVLPKEAVARLRVSSECVYVLGKGCVEVIYLNKEKGQRRVVLEDAREQPEDLLITAILEEEIILLQFPTSIAITAEGKNLA